MNSFSVTSARDDFADVLRSVGQGPVEITRHGKTIAVMIDPVLFDKLSEAAEEIADIEAFDAAEEDDSPRIPWELVKKDLGLT